MSQEILIYKLLSTFAMFSFLGALREEWKKDWFEQGSAKPDHSARPRGISPGPPDDDFSRKKWRCSHVFFEVKWIVGVTIIDLFHS